jgi:ubiquinone/menaquinone biosynthesis C-methylase UbiE
MTHPTPHHILDLASAYWSSCALLTAAEMKIFTRLHDQPRSAGALADDVGLDRRATRLLLDALVATQLLRQVDGVYHNTADADAFLVEGQPGDLSRALKYNRDVYPAWGRLRQLVETGTPVEKPSLHLGDDAQRTERFVRSMDARARAIGRAVVPMIDLDQATQLLDVGGGPGTYASLIAERKADLHCTVIDLPGIVAVAETLVAGSSVADQITFQPGDYHTATFPDGQDIVLFFGMLHQESPESICDLLARAHTALKPGGQVYIMDMMTDETRAEPAFSALFAVNMALTTEDGWVFSDADLIGWLAGAGFTQPTCQPLPSPMPHWLVSAKKQEMV